MITDDSTPDEIIEWWAERFGAVMDVLRDNCPSCWAAVVRSLGGEPQEKATEKFSIGPVEYTTVSQTEFEALSEEGPDVDYPQCKATTRRGRRCRNEVDDSLPQEMGNCSCCSRLVVTITDLAKLRTGLCRVHSEAAAR